MVRRLALIVAGVAVLLVMVLGSAARADADQANADKVVGTYYALATKAPEKMTNPRWASCFNGVVVTKGDPVKVTKDGANGLLLTLATGDAWHFEAAKEQPGPDSNVQSLWYGRTGSDDKDGQLELTGAIIYVTLNYGAFTTGGCAGVFAAELPHSIPSEPATSPQTPGSPSLGLTCEQAHLDDLGRSDCSAAVAKAPPGAALVYSWTVDGIARAETGALLRVEDLTVGSHRVSVSVRDTASTLTLGPESAVLARSAPGSGSKGGIGGVVPLVVAGGGIATTLAIGGLVAGRRRRRPPRVPLGPLPPPGYGRGAPPQPGYLAGPPTTTVPAPPVAPPSPPAGPSTPLGPPDLPEILRPPTGAPATDGPEVLGPPAGVPGSLKDRRQRQRSEPTASVQLLLRPSVLTERFFSTTEPQLIGDGIDAAFAGFVVTVGPPGEWEQDGPGEATWTITGGKSYFVDMWDEMRHTRPDRLAYADPTAVRTDANNVVLVTEWHPSDGQLQVELTVRVRVRHADGTVRPDPLVAQAAPAVVPVVGANPRGTTAATTTSAERLGLPLDEESVVADADGTTYVRVEPMLEVFRTTHGGGLATRMAEMTVLPAEGELHSLGLADLFVIQQDRDRVDSGARPDLDKGIEGLALRCKFRFGDAPFDRLDGHRVPIGTIVVPTGKSFGLDSPDPDPFSWMMPLHNQAVAAHLKDGVRTEPVTVVLRPSIIEVARPEPDVLPNRAVDEADKWISKITATVRSASGDVVKGSVVEGDLTIEALENWKLAVWYDSPTEEWRQKVDPGCSRDSARTFPVEKIDEEGHLVFGRRSFLRYDHVAVFEPVVVSNEPDAERYVPGQTCTIQVEARVTSSRPVAADRGAQPKVTFVGPSITIGGIDVESRRLTLEVVADSGEPLVDARVDALGKRWRTDIGGRVTIDVPGPVPDLVLDIQWQTCPRLGPSARDATSPWPSVSRLQPERAWGTTVKKKLLLDLTADETRQVILPVSTKWAIQTDRTFTAGPSFYILGGGYLRMTAFIINRARMPAGEVSVAPRHTPAAAEVRSWRRITFNGEYTMIGGGVDLNLLQGKAPEFPIGFSVDQPGATPFETRTPIAFADFNGQGAEMGIVGSISIGVIGSSHSWVSFFQVTTRPARIDTSSWSKGIPGLALIEQARGWWTLQDWAMGESPDD